MKKNILVFKILTASLIFLANISSKAGNLGNNDPKLFAKQADSMYFAANSDFMKARSTYDTLLLSKTKKEWAAIVSLIDGAIAANASNKILTGFLGLLKDNVKEIQKSLSRINNTFGVDESALKKNNKRSFHDEKYVLNGMQDGDLTLLKGHEESWSAILKDVVKQWK